MSRLIIRHETRYAYERPVAFGPHQLLVRPRGGHALRVVKGALTFSPRGETRWRYDAYGNCVCQLNVSEESDEFFILSEENEDGQLTLSIRRIEYQRAWERVRQLQKEDATIYSEVFATNRGGALVRVEGLRGFIPGSHISTRKPKEELVAEFLPLKFLEVDEERNRLVLSHRRALVERKMNRLEVGEVVIGTVRGIKPYGAFIDIGGVSGLLHISEISHEHIETPHSVLNVNDQMKVMIIDLDAERGRISLSTKALEPEPGDMLTDPQKVFEKAEEMAARYKQMLLEQAEDGEMAYE